MTDPGKFLFMDQIYFLFLDLHILKAAVAQVPLKFSVSISIYLEFGGVDSRCYKYWKMLQYYICSFFRASDPF